MIHEISTIKKPVSIELLDQNKKTIYLKPQEALAYVEDVYANKTRENTLTFVRVHFADGTQTYCSAFVNYLRDKATEIYLNSGTHGDYRFFFLGKEVG